MVGRVLEVPDAVIDEIEADKDKVSKKCYRKCSLCSYKTMSYNTWFCIVDKLLFSKVIRIEKLFDLNNVF